MYLEQPIIVVERRTVYDTRMPTGDAILYEDGLDFMLDEDGVAMEYE